MSHMFGEGFLWEAIRRQICDNRHRLGINQNPLSLLLVHAPRQRRHLFLGIGFRLGICFRLLLWTIHPIRMGIRHAKA